MGERSQAVQVLGSLLVALMIAAATVAIVTAKLGPTSAAEQEAIEDRIDLREERLKERQDRLEERQKQREENR
jgi:sensor domain CHASE-containing protein